MILRSATSKSLVLFDFLAPNLLSRTLTSSQVLASDKRSTKPLRTPVLPAAVFKNIRENVTQQLRTREVVASDQQADVYNATLVQITEALGKEDAVAARRLWVKLKKLNLADILDSKLVSMMSALLIKAFLPPSSKIWDRATQLLVEEVAVSAASCDAEGVATCMLYHIKRKDPNSALALYDRCTHIMSNKEAWDEDDSQESQEDTDSQNDLAFGLADLSHSGMHPIRGRVRLLLAAVTANAMLDTFQEALTMCKNTNVRFHSYTTREFLEHLHPDSDLRTKVDHYTNRLHHARLVSRPVSLSRQITNLGDSHALTALTKLYHAIREGILGPDPYIAADESSLSSQRTVTMTVVGWTSFLTAFLKCSAKDVAAQVWEDISICGLRHDTSMWNALISGQAQSFADATATFELMKSQDIRLDAITYRALISSLFNGRRPNLAMHRFQEFQAANITDTPENILSVYNTVINGLLVRNRIDAASSLFQEMMTKGPKPDVVSYNTFLGHYARRNDIRGLGMLVSRMGESGITGDVFTFSTILSALLKIGRPDASEVVFRLMEKQGIKPNTATYSALIDHQMREHDEAHLSGALRLLSRMEADPTIAPNIITYTSILAGIHRGTPWLTKQKEDDFTRAILDRMKQHNVKLNTRAYNILIKACLNGRRLDQAVSYYEEMKRIRMPMFQETWYILLEGLIRMQEWDVATEVIKEMTGLYGVHPSGPLKGLVKRITSRKEY
ncbi:hypothetical protein EV361DRAFT_888078 [Lentinula raphanica]|uniref:Pentatricopeptide repeat-containing protein n=1 Tax=Lentinula raphanica TaxID=153919 RepID=A0AA38PKG7_9AGAR|nr:hypothetical protein F5880DRAFT_1519901 [Lentinula raphanica]KAJ3844285.1 hypothetical protein F5878DRAFT_602338 [Lentinula raphanica]KAJ3975547.1 hypothetical protein EV361DRAFT_888078 [Lentinula raphanica]